VRYGLLVELTGRDTETKLALELLAHDKDMNVASQAFIRYVSAFARIDATLFNPEVVWPMRFPIPNLPDADKKRALVDYCLGKNIVLKPGWRADDTGRAIPVLDPKNADEPAMADSLMIVGILGRAEDAKALYPFLQSKNDYVALNAAKALARLGDTEKAVEGLKRLATQDVKEHLHYITQALYVLQEIKQPEYRNLVLAVLDEVEKQGPLQNGWVNEFWLLAAGVKPDVWK